MKLTDAIPWRFRDSVMIFGIPVTIGELLLSAALCVAGSLVFGYAVHAILSVALRAWGDMQ